MASYLYVTYSKSIPPGGGGRALPIADGSEARTEKIQLDNTAGGGVGSLSCATGEDIVSLKAQAACLVEIAAAPTAGTEVDCWFLDDGDRIELWVDPGEKVAVVAV